MKPEEENVSSRAVEREYLTARVGDQIFGVGIDKVHDVFVPQGMTRVPNAPPAVAGILNLRGRIVTAIDMRRRLDLPDREEDAPAMAIGITWHGESYGLIIDAVGDVLRLEDASIDVVPVNLHATWAALSKGVYKSDDKLIVVLDVGSVLGFGESEAAA